ncbi:MAG: DNA methyltransferase [Pseudomonadota bacterium]
MGPGLLALELQELVDFDFEVELTGFSLAEIDYTLDGAREADADGLDAPEDELPGLLGNPISKRGDLWSLGNHWLLCGDARSSDDFATLMAADTADLVFTDPPYNVKIDGNVCGKGEVKHRESAFASGEMSQSEFTNFLALTSGNTAQVMRDGSIAFVCMDWRHIGELLSAGGRVFTDLKNLIVWNKTNGGMGTFYRSKHELIFAFKHGTSEHTNSFGLGETGRYRTNVWGYAGISSIGPERAEELAMHPTVKPVALVAAEKTGRRARLIEYDPIYCDTIISRWEAYTGKSAVHHTSDRPYEALQEAADV